MSDFETTRRYWSQQIVKAPELLGVAALGGCGLTEVIYRHHEEVRTFTRLVPLEKTAAFLEIGCGNGRWITALAPRVADYEAVDFSPQMLAVARTRVAEAGLGNVHLVAAAAQDYVPGRTFDVIYLSGVTQYLHDAELTQLLRRLRASLAAGGVIVDRSTVHRRARAQAEQAGYFSIYRTAGELIGLFASSGLDCRARERSYAFLNFSGPVRRVLGTRPAAALARMAAPWSFTGLRRLAAWRDARCPPTGELVDYSHDFFLFRAQEKT